MNTENRKVFSNYNEVSKTTTYSIFATLPVFLLYHLGLDIVNYGHEQWMINGIHGAIHRILAHIGMPPGIVFFLVIVLAAGISRREQARNIIHFQHIFFVRTFFEATLLASVSGLLVLCLIKYGFYHQEFFSTAYDGDTLLSNITFSLGAGFYEGILIAGLTNLLLLGAKKSDDLYTANWIFSVVFTSIVFAFIHRATFIYADIAFDDSMFLYKVMYGLALSLIYITRGFATMVWAHILFNFWILSGYFLG